MGCRSVTPVTIFVVRHAHAQSREAWMGDDDGRPLTKRGRRQAQGLVTAIGDRPISRIVSSPAMRCVETVQPLADKVSADVEIDRLLAEGAEAAAVLERARSLDRGTDGDAVLCTHGDVVPEILRLVTTQDGTTFGDDLRWAKGSAWALESDGERFTVAEYVAPTEQ